ncbi:MAG: TetR/AcrR family transcriptional regulator [Burkholderiales bacterium]|nr:TetR/AcrR family transcriptional regulator [Burkholderiales bacterium]MDR4516116.1 TetR/AcrR family transcriptional regulator [Nitrosomonas sp.]
MTDYCDIREAIVDKAVEIAEHSSWEAVRFFDIAAELNITLDDIRCYFREKEELIDAWFDRADGAMLKVAEQEEFLSLCTQKQLHRLIMTWLDAMAAHRAVTRQMIGAKLEPGHIHIQIPAIMRISRTVQWMREAAQRDATFLRRALEETALTTLYLATFTHWMFDESDQSQRTRSFLTYQLQMAEILDHTVFAQTQKKTRPSTEPASPEKPKPIPEMAVNSMNTDRTVSVEPANTPAENATVQMHSKSG